MIKELKCAISDDEHFLIKPISLACGHSICQKCILDGHNEGIKCKICDLVSNQDLTQIQVSNEAQQAIQFNIGDIFQILEKETSDRLNELKSMIKNLLILILSIFILIKIKLKSKMIFWVLPLIISKKKLTLELNQLKTRWKRLEIKLKINF